MKHTAAILTALLLAVSANADDGKPPSSTQRNTGLAVFAEANAYWASDVTANFYSGTPTATDNTGGIYRILHSNTYGRQIWQDLRTNRLITDAVGDYTMLTVAEFPQMHYRISYQIGLGIRYDTEEGAALLLNVGLNEKKFNGSKLNLSAKLSYNPKISLKYTYSRSSFANFNVSGDYRNEHFRSRGIHDKYVNFHYQQTKASAYVSEFHLLNINTNVGASFVHTTFDKTSIMGSAFDSIYYVNNDMLSPFITFQYDNLDDPYFANHGILSTIGSHYYYMTSTKEKFMDISYSFQAYVTPNNGRFTIIPQVYGRYVASIASDASSIQYYNLRNICGGEIAGRHFENQMPFIGLTSIDDLSIDLTQNTSILRCDLRYNFYGKHYLTAMYNTIMPWGLLGTGGMNFTDIIHFMVHGAGLKYSYNSLLGPVSLTAQWLNNDGLNHFGAYFSFGYTF